MKNILISAGVAVLVVVFGFMFFVPKPNVVTQVLGSASSPSVVDGCMDVNGVVSCYRSAKMNQASTTLCALKSPSATSTLVHGSLSITTGSTTAAVVEMGKSTSFAATTTSLGTVNLAASALTTTIASTSPTTNGVDGVSTFTPNTYFVVKYGGSGGPGNAYIGNCKAQFIVD